MKLRLSLLAVFSLVLLTSPVFADEHSPTRLPNDELVGPKMFHLNSSLSLKAANDHLAGPAARRVVTNLTLFALQASNKIKMSETVTSNINSTNTQSVTGTNQNEVIPDFGYPLSQYARVRSPFGNRRVSRKRKIYRFHNGVDLAANKSTPVLASVDGEITWKGRMGNYGRLIKIKHENGYSTRYAHLLSYASSLKVGMKVRKGDIIGYVGTSGRSTGYHLHFEIRKDGKAINPMEFIQFGDKSTVTVKEKNGDKSN